MKQLVAGIAIGAVGCALLGFGPVATQASVHAAHGGLGAAGRSTCSRRQEAANKAIIASLKPGSPAFHDLIADDYVQHSAEYARVAQINGISSKAAVSLIERYGLGKTRGRLAAMAAAPGKPADNLAYKVIAECDFVVAVGEHWHPDPQFPGKYYPTYFFNMWRMKDGKMAEHWDPDDLPTPLPEHLMVPVSQIAGLHPAEPK